MSAADLRLTFYSLLTLAVLLLGLELALRLAGFGFRAPVFKPQPPPCLVQGNCGSADRGIFEKKDGLYVTRPEYLGWFQAQEFPARKPAGEFRVFVLGGSSIYNLYDEMKKPYQAAGRTVRAINMGGNSFGTARLLPVFEEVLGYDPDLVIVYSGHSEFVDITIVNDLINTSPLKEKLRALLRHFRVFDLAELAVYKTGMTAMRLKKRHDNGVVRYFSSRLRPGTDKAKVYSLYAGYLATMARLARARKVPLAFSTVAYNRVIPPVVPAQARALHAQGLALRSEGRYREALALLDKAHDMELVPFGANETSNGIVRRVAREYGVPLIEVDAAALGRAPDGIPGAETFLDQCHFTDSRFLGELFRKEIREAVGKNGKYRPGGIKEEHASR